MIDRIDVTLAIDRFLDAERRAGKTDATLRNYRADLGGLRRSAGARVSGTMLAGALRRHLDALTIAERSWNRHLTTLRRFCDHLVRAGALAANPIAGIERLATESTPPIVAGAAAVRRLMNRIDSPRDRALIAMLWQTGLRVGEALRLRAGDVDLARGVVVVPPPPVFRSVRLADVVRTALREYLAERRPDASDPMFAAQGGRALSYAGAHRAFRRYAGASGLTMQSLRGRAAKQAFDDGATVAHVQNMLGHRSAASTIRYHSDFQSVRKKL